MQNRIKAFVLYPFRAISWAYACLKAWRVALGITAISFAGVYLLIGFILSNVIIQHFPWLEPLFGSPSGELADYALYSLLPALLFTVALFCFLVILAPSQIHFAQETAIEELTARLKTIRECRVPLSLTYEEDKHFDKANQSVAFAVTMDDSDKQSRIQQIHVYIKSLVPVKHKKDVRQMGVQFCNHELAPMRNAQNRGFRLDPGGTELIRFVWTTPEDDYIYFSGYDVNGALNPQGFRTLKTTYKVTVCVQSRNGTYEEALFHIGRKNDGRLTFRRLAA